MLVTTSIWYFLVPSIWYAPATYSWVLIEDPYWKHIKETSEVINSVMYIILSVVSQFHWEMLKKVARWQEKLTTHHSSWFLFNFVLKTQTEEEPETEHVFLSSTNRKWEWPCPLPPYLHHCTFLKDDVHVCTNVWAPPNPDQWGVGSGLCRPGQTMAGIEELHHLEPFLCTHLTWRRKGRKEVCTEGNKDSPFTVEWRGHNINHGLHLGRGGVPESWTIQEQLKKNDFCSLQTVLLNWSQTKTINHLWSSITRLHNNSFHLRGYLRINATSSTGTGYVSSAVVHGTQQQHVNRKCMCLL